MCALWERNAAHRDNVSARPNTRFKRISWETLDDTFGWHNDRDDVDPILNWPNSNRHCERNRESALSNANWWRKFEKQLCRKRNKFIIEFLHRALDHIFCQLMTVRIWFGWKRIDDISGTVMPSVGILMRYLLHLVALLMLLCHNKCVCMHLPLCAN